jgi:hypothetical protein
MRLFCDQCGSPFGELTLREDSKFCPLCGKPLSEFVKQECKTLFKSQGQVEIPKVNTTNHASPGKRTSIVVEVDRSEGLSHYGARKARPEDDWGAPIVKRRRGRPRKHPEITPDTRVVEVIEEDSSTEAHGELGERVLTFHKRATYRDRI